jgi:hypothetical protein
VALGGLTAGYFAYRNVKSPAEDKLQIPVLKNKWYFDEIYERSSSSNPLSGSRKSSSPSGWIKASSTASSTLWTKHGRIRSAIRKTSTCPSSIASLAMVPLMRPGGLGQNLRPIQTGRIQQYLILSLIVLFVVGGLLYFLLLA